MTQLVVRFDLTREGFQLCAGEDPTKCVHVTNHMEIGRVPHGTVDGKATVMLKGRTRSGRLIIFETTLALLSNAVQTLVSFEAEVQRANKGTN